MSRLRFALVTASAIAAVLLGAGLAHARRAADTTPPTISGATDIVTPATSDYGETFAATVNYSFTVTDPDNTSDQLMTVCQGPLNPVHLAGTSYESCQARDPAGNLSAPVTFTVTVTVPAPTFQNVPGPITAQATGPAGAVVTFVKPTATDVGSRAVPVSCDQISGITYPVGTTPVNCTATIKRTDSVGNPITYTTGTTQFTVTVTAAGSTGGTATGGGGTSGGGGSSAGGGTSGGGAGGGASGGGSSAGGGETGGASKSDSTPPTIARKTNVTVNATGARGATVAYTVTATDVDNASAQVVISCLPASGATFELGRNSTTKSTTVTCQARDSAGNAATPMSFRVTVLGAHDELAAVEAQVNASANLQKAQKSVLRSDLVRADRYIAAGDKNSARCQLKSFIRVVIQLPTPLTSDPTMWIQSARRVIALLS